MQTPDIDSLIIKCKGSVIPVLNQFGTMPWWRMGEWRYYSFLIASLYEVGSRLNIPSSLPPGREPPVTFGWGLKGSRSRSGHCELSVAPSGIQPWPFNTWPVAVPTELSRIPRRETVFVPICFFIKNSYINNVKSQDSAVDRETGYETDARGVGIRVPVGPRNFFYPLRPDRLWSPFSLLSNGYRGLFSRG
jgi:hypothetical protein